jgi:hypothetical protein
MSESEKRNYVKWALHQRRGDDLERAKMAFGKMDDSQLDCQWGQSGKTPREIWQEYKDSAAKYDEVMAWCQQKGVV